MLNIHIVNYFARFNYKITKGKHMTNNIYSKQLLNHKLKDRELAEFWVHRYVRFIEWCRSKNHCYNGNSNRTHLHHIVPRSMKGSDDLSNLAVLTFKEHLVAHHILAKTKITKATQGLNAMINSHLDEFNYVISLRILDDLHKLQVETGLSKRVVNLTLKCVYESIGDASRSLFNGRTVGITYSIQVHRKVAGCYLIFEKDINGRTYQQCIEEFDKINLIRKYPKFKDPLVNITQNQIIYSSYELQQLYSKYEKAQCVSCYILNKTKDLYGNYWTRMSKIPIGVSNDQLQKQYEQNEIQKEINLMNKVGKPVICIKTMKIYNNAVIAQKELGLHEGAVGHAIRTHRQTGGSYWMLYHECLNQQEIDNYIQKAEQGYDERDAWSKAVINLHTGQEFKSQTDAARFLNVEVGVFSALTRKHNRVKGQYFAYKEDVEKYGQRQLLEQYQQERKQRKAIADEKARHNSLCKRVKCIELNQEFESTQAAADFVKGNTSGISQACNHKIERYKNYHWEFV